MNYPNRIAWWSLMSSVCPEHVSHLAPEGLYRGNAMDGFASLPASTIRYFTSKRELIRINSDYLGDLRYSHCQCPALGTSFKARRINCDVFISKEYLKYKQSLRSQSPRHSYLPRPRIY
jgi:hypothetical protein